MSDRDLDRPIDAAARQLIAREPGRALTHAVMARVREDEKPRLQRLAWIAAPAGMLVCAAIAITILNRLPQTLPAVAAPPPLAIGQPLTALEPPIVLAHVMVPSRRNRSVVSSRAIASNTAAVPRDVSPIAPIDAEPITVAAIHVPRLESFAPVSIEALNIEQLTVEPLAASND